MKRIISFYMCFAMCLALFAQATDLTIDNQTPGWLSSKINYGDQQTVKNLTITGYIDGEDLKFIGSLIQNQNLNGHVDLSEVNVVNIIDSNSEKTDNYMGENAFALKSSCELKCLLLPKSLTKIYRCLSSNLKLDTLIFEPNKLNYVEANFFQSTQYGKAINNLILGERVDSIPNNAFLEYSGLKSVYFKGDMRYIGTNAFRATNIEKANIEALNNLDFLGGHAFDCHMILDTLYVPVKLESFYASSFLYQEDAHIFFGPNLKAIYNGKNGQITNYFNTVSVYLHFKANTPPYVEKEFNHLTHIYIPKGSKSAYEAVYKIKYATIIEEKPVESIELSQHELLIEKDGKKQMSVTILPSDADDKTITWTSENDEIATVDKNGLVTGVTAGTTRIHATSVPTGLKDICEVTVIQHATDIQMGTSQVTMTKIGETEQLAVTVLPENTTDKSVKWTSSNSSVCTVTASGMIVAMGYGEAVVMAITNDGNLPATCVVRVTPEKYKLTYIVDHVVYKSYDVEYTSAITPEAFPTKEGYTFSGWNGLPSTMPAKDVTVTGSFTVNKYKMTYVVDGVVYKTSDMEYGASITPESEPTKEGYSFSGWSMIPTTMPARDITITGSFTKGQYKLTYIVDGQTYKTVSMDYGVSVTPEYAPEKEGYTFSGWNEIPATMPAKDVIVTGSFKVNAYTLTYVLDGETYKTFNMNYGDAITAETEPQKEGYTFSGWSEIPATMPAKDVIVTGSFKVNAYTLTYVLDGETYKTFNMNYGDAITAEAEPQKEGYTFSGWSTIPATMPAKDVIVIGNFTLVDAIEDVIANDNTYQIYTIDGKPINSLQKGVNIIRYSNGQTKKVFIK